MSLCLAVFGKAMQKKCPRAFLQGLKPRPPKEELFRTKTEVLRRGGGSYRRRGMGPAWFGPQRLLGAAWGLEREAAGCVAAGLARLGSHHLFVW
jgi:hypothetical protein